jgi:hypothetical protein
VLCYSLQGSNRISLSSSSSSRNKKCSRSIHQLLWMSSGSRRWPGSAPQHTTWQPIPVMCAVAVHLLLFEWC